jgi:non-specific serine/threonine protein kinase/serine/threonine-protein kinase
LEAERWTSVKRVFQEALPLREQEQARYLEEVCSGKPWLRAEVDSLLSAYRQADEMGRRSAQPESTTADHMMWDPWLGRKIGPYQPIAKIGEGGMGVVYRAVRVDDHYLKQLAIKVLREGRVAESDFRRFRNERQILASLEHANIARLLDGGATEDGHPYFVMEYVEGERIDEYCDARRLNIAQRLKLFRQVCEAVQYAHQKLVVHRDLKPANILVTVEGIPKLLDFGIAKLLDPELFFQTANLTMTMARPMTPEYASPEQIRGAGVATTSDVYSLGVVLYRLLTGHPPYNVESQSPAEMARTICEQEPERPSIVIGRKETVMAHDGQPVTLTPESVSKIREGHHAILRKRLSGDLDNILLKALHKDPARRYGSAEQLGDDLGRYLDGLPVLARPDTLFYRAGKYVKRHRIPVIAAVLVLLSLVGGLAATARQARIARAAQARAERRFNDVRKIAHDLIFEIHDSIQNLPGATPARKLIVQDAMSYLDRLAKESSEDLSLQHELAIAYQKVGDVQGLDVRSNLGDTAGALTSYEKSLDILESLAKSNPQDRKLRSDLADTYSRLAAIQLEMGQTASAFLTAQKNLEIATELEKTAEPSDRQAQLNLALAYDGLSNIQADSGNFDGSVDSCSKSLAIFDVLLAAEPANAQYRRGVSLEHKKIGGVYEYTGRLDKGLVEYRKALPMDEARASENPSDTLARRDLSISYSNVGDVLLKRGEIASALTLYQQAAAIDDAIAAADPKDAWARRYQVYNYRRVGDALLKRGDIAGAREAYRKTMAAAEQRAGLDETNAGAQADLAYAYSRLAEACHASGSRAGTVREKQKNLVAARGWYRKSLVVWEQLRRKGAIVAIDVQAPELVSSGLTRCEQELKSLGSPPKAQAFND